MIAPIIRIDKTGVGGNVANPVRARHPTLDAGAVDYEMLGRAAVDLCGPIRSAAVGIVPEYATGKKCIGKAFYAHGPALIRGLILSEGAIHQNNVRIVSGIYRSAVPGLIGRKHATPQLKVGLGAMDCSTIMGRQIADEDAIDELDIAVEMVVHSRPVHSMIGLECAVAYCNAGALAIEHTCTPVTTADRKSVHLNFTIGLDNVFRVVAGVRTGLISLEEACQRYSLSVDEFLSWQTLLDAHGMNGLRATRLKKYRQQSGKA